MYNNHHCGSSTANFTIIELVCEGIFQPDIDFPFYFQKRCLHKRWNINKESEKFKLQCC